MSQRAINSKRPNYGIEVPGVVHGMTIAGVAGIVLGIILYATLKSAQPLLAVVLLNLGLWGGVLNLLMVGGMVWSSKVGKFRERDRLLDTIPWRGDETVLDVGCGRGLLLTAACKRLITGKALGVDIWQSEHHSDNRPGATWENIQAEGVADRAKVSDGDARCLPFEDNVFDVVVSSLTLHNISDQVGRARALQEMVRVLKPGGRLALLDIKHTDEYVPVLRQEGLRDVERVGPHFLYFFPAYIVIGHG